MTDHDCPFRACEDVFRRKFGNATTLLQMSTGNYFSLNAVGDRAWELLAEPRSARQISEVIANEFEAPFDSICADVAALLEHLAADRLIAG